MAAAAAAADLPAQTANPVPAIDYRKATDGTRVIAEDPWLEPFAPALRERYAMYKKWADDIQQTEGGLEPFSRGYERLGFTVDPRTHQVTYREWAPGAVKANLIGDFNGWNRDAHEMRKDAFGVWEVVLPPKENGVCAIPHGSKVKISMIAQSGERIERLPAWIK